jgi:hypothetical protein
LGCLISANKEGVRANFFVFGRSLFALHFLTASILDFTKGIFAKSEGLA